MRLIAIICATLLCAAPPQLALARPAQSVAVERPSLPFATVPNLRDLGGIKTIKGKHVRPGLLYRSDQLDKMSDDDLARMAQLKLATIIDLRTEGERKRGADRVPEGVKSLQLDVLGGSGDLASISGEIAKRGGEPVMIDLYRRMASDAQADAAYRAMFVELGKGEGPLLYHCTAGKDRTGWGTAVLLTLLGVKREDILADFLASNGMLAKKNEAMYAMAAKAGMAREKVEPMMTVRPVYLEASIAEAEKRFGSINAYAEKALGIDAKAVKRLRKLYLTR